MSSQPAAQADLFAPSGAAETDLFGHRTPVVEPPSPEFVGRIRAELEGSVAEVAGAARLPWADYTRSALAELRFESLCGWLPAGEAAGLRAAYARELDRLYALEPGAGSDAAD